MLKIEIIGNLGADAETRELNGRKFYTFRVAHTDRTTDQNTGETREKTIWANCIANNLSEGLLALLTKGQKIFIRGRADLRVFSSEKYRQMMAGLDVNVTEIELCGASKAEKEFMEGANATLLQLQELGYTTIDEVPRKEETNEK